MKPEEIETQSFQIIDAEAGSHDFPPDQWQIVRRMVHTSADFEYIQTVRIHPQAIQAGLKAIKAGRSIFTDTHMAQVGIRKNELIPFGVSVKCLITDATVVEIARQQGITRAQAAVTAAIDGMQNGIYVIGNAPTALLRLIELINQKKARPALIIGLPVGFVNAAESKAALLELDFPQITNVGRKGGSTLAAGVVNALAIMAYAEHGK